MENDFYESLFRTWLAKYGKSENDASYDYPARYSTFVENFKKVKKHNSENDQYYLALNQFADMKFEEFSSKYLAPQYCSATGGSVNFSKTQFSRLKTFEKQIPKHVDWRDKKVVSPVKNQRQCGSCWTFSTTGAVESHYAIQTGKILDLSEQQLVDCAGNFENHGCNGGLPSHAFEYIKYNGGIEQESDYPYLAHDSECKFQADRVAVQVVDSVNITSGDEISLMEAVSTIGPVSIAYTCADDFHLYAGGVYSNDHCRSLPTDVNHAVLAVGFGQLNDGTLYWIVKNSWGADWGMQGYFQILRGENMCGLADCASYPILLDQKPDLM